MPKQSKSYIKKIYDKTGSLIAVIFSLSTITKEDKTIFVSIPIEWGIHLGIAHRKKGYSVNPHYHKRTAIGERIGTECLIVLDGKINIKLYSMDDNSITANLDLSKGEGIIMRCPHSVEYQLRSTVLEIKEGPYPAANLDKVWL